MSWGSLFSGLLFSEHEAHSLLQMSSFICFSRHAALLFPFVFGPVPQSAVWSCWDSMLLSRKWHHSVSGLWSPPSNFLFSSSELPRTTSLPQYVRLVYELTWPHANIRAGAGARARSARSVALPHCRAKKTAGDNYATVKRFVKHLGVRLCVCVCLGEVVLTCLGESL